MRWSRFFIPTVRETPADAVAPSHRLMIRAGLIRQVAAGSYSYLPLGYRTLRKVERIVREEMDRAGAIELHMPAMQPIELWEETGRTLSMGTTLVRLPDQPWRRGTVLGPTHEEVVTDIARHFINSYKQLPVNLYQIQTKFRDEQRPKSGVLRTREFLMKDAYSFDADKAGLDVSYQKMYDAYCRIYSRCGLPYVAVEAESGPIGGDASHEFMVVTPAGEDVMVQCASCGHAANVERATPAPLPKQSDAPAPLTEVHTPGQRTIDEVTKFLRLGPERMIKTLIYRGRDGQTIVGLVRGDHEINELKLARAAGVAGVELADEKTIEALTGAPVGFAGPHSLRGKATIVADQAVSVMVNAATGANKGDFHVTGLNPGRDFNADVVADIRSAVEGDRCNQCGGALTFQTSIEVGHVFKLGTKYTDAMKANFLDEHGKSHPMIMGCYGIGLNRIMAAAIEAHHDESGIIWPVSIAPYEVLIVALDYDADEQVRQTADGLYESLLAAGVDMLLDDRDMRPGPKFKDADLIGVPLRVTVGKKGLADGVVEFKPRDRAEAEKIAPTAAVEHVLSALNAARATLEPA